MPCFGAPVRMPVRVVCGENLYEYMEGERRNGEDAVIAVITASSVLYGGSGVGRLRQKAR